jgi:hypothetical protein
MARGAAVAAKKPAAKAAAAGKPAVKRAAKTAAADTELDELSALAAANKELEDAERAKTGGNNLYIALVQGNSSILIEGDPRYIKGVKMHDFVIAQNKLRLGATLDATILGTFKLYEEKAKKEKENEMAPTVGFWMPEQAEMVALGDGELFARPLTNGNVLLPVHWVFLYLHDHPELEGAMLAFRSTGNKVFTQLRKLLKQESTICTELRFKIGKQGIRNETYARTIFYSEFTIAGKNFDYEDDKVKLIKGAMGKDEVKVVLERSKELQEEYARNRMVTLRNENAVAALIGTQPIRAALPAAREAPDDGDHEATQF